MVGGGKSNSCPHCGQFRISGWPSSISIPNNHYSVCPFLVKALYVCWSAVHAADGTHFAREHSSLRCSPLKIAHIGPLALLVSQRLGASMSCASNTEAPIVSLVSSVIPVTSTVRTLRVPRDRVGSHAGGMRWFTDL